MAAAVAAAGGTPLTAVERQRGVANGGARAVRPPGDGRDAHAGGTGGGGDGSVGDGGSAGDGASPLPTGPTEADVAALRAGLAAAASRNAQLASDMAALEVAAGMASRSKDAMVRQLEAALATAERNLQTLLGREEARCRREAEAAAAAAAAMPPSALAVTGGGGGDGGGGGSAWRPRGGDAGGSRSRRGGGRADSRADGGHAEDGLLVV